jgi:hypothetical protein
MPSSYYRKDGVKITHDPYAPGMAAKYGAPGKTDADGFDPYADSVGAGIYSGTVQRAADGSVVIGRQYQGHNPRPGPVYSGGGYTPVSEAISRFHAELRSGAAEADTTLAKLLDAHPDLVNDVATGGASPLHTCGMSRSNQHATAFLIARGADVAATDTYGYTPLDRMASNNLAVGAAALLAFGAEPDAHGPPFDVAMDAEAKDVLAVLEKYEERVTDKPVTKIVVHSEVEPAVAGTYTRRPASEIPEGFRDVCVDNGWDVDATWRKLNGGGEDGAWFKKDADASYIYFNRSDQNWWIDGPDGLGVYKGPGPDWAPMGMSTAWRAIDGGSHAPTLAIYRA